MSSKINRYKISSFLAQDSITWYFIPAKSPHMCGIWEAAVKFCKFHLKRILGTASVSFEEMYTILTQIESCLNSRPLTPLSNDLNDYLPLTPSHFIIGDSLSATPQIDVQKKNFTKLSRYHRMQHHFWSRWCQEYLNQLQQRSKWKVAFNHNLKIGTLVILKEDNLTPLHWPMARIIELHPGADEVVRVVTVKVASGSVYKRSVSKICALPLDEATNPDVNLCKLYINNHLYYCINV